MQESTFEKVRNELDALTKRIKEQPLTSVAQAAAIGYALRWLPFGSVVMTALKMVGPAIGVFGFLKACDGAESLTKSPRKSKK